MSARLIPDTSEELGELDFGMDGFRKQKVLRGVNAYARLVDRLLRKRKGTTPSEPDMGIDLESYRFADIDSLVAGSLQNVIQNQISKYIPGIPLNTINISTMKVRNSTVLYITIELLQDKTKLTLSYLQKKRSIVSMQVNVEKQSYINAQKKTSDDV